MFQYLICSRKTSTILIFSLIISLALLVNKAPIQWDIEYASHKHINGHIRSSLHSSGICKTVLLQSSNFMEDLELLIEMMADVRIFIFISIFHDTILVSSSQIGISVLPSTVCLQPGRIMREIKWKFYLLVGDPRNYTFKSTALITKKKLM